MHLGREKALQIKKKTFTIVYHKQQVIRVGYEIMPYIALTAIGVEKKTRKCKCQ